MLKTMSWVMTVVLILLGWANPHSTYFWPVFGVWAVMLLTMAYRNQRQHRSK